jgi:hypothetical protein
MRAARRTAATPVFQQKMTRRALLQRAPAATVGLAGATWMLEQPFTRQVIRVLLASVTNPRSPITDAPSGYFHGIFNLERPEDVAEAAAVGINYTLGYGHHSWESADPESPLGQAHLRYGMRTFLDIQGAALSCRRGAGRVDAVAVRELVGRFYQSPLLAGYWTKDDDCGSEGTAVKEIAAIIRSIDPDPRHLIMPGYSGAPSLARNYVHGQADVLGFYPYPAFSSGPAGEVPEMLHIVRERTPRGAHPPPFIGIYQVFGLPPRISRPSAQEVVRQVSTYRALGAVGVAGYGWNGTGLTHIPANDATLRQAVADVTQWMITGPGRANTRGIQAG